MLLSFIQNLKNYFSNISFFDLIPFFLGVALGFILCALIYILVLLGSVKKETNKIEKISVDREIINIKINNTKNRYLAESNSLKTNERINLLKDVCWELMNDIASSYYPSSPHPLFELSIEELIQLDYYIMNRIESIFSSKILSYVKKVRIVTIEKLLDRGKKINNSKIKKTADKVKPVAKGFWTALNVINPIYWIKKMVYDIPYNVIMKRIATTIIEIIGVETSNVYSKDIFGNEENYRRDKELIDKEIREIEKIIGDVDDE